MKPCSRLGTQLARAAVAAFFCLQLLPVAPAQAEVRVKLRADHVDTDRGTGISHAVGGVRLEVEGAVLTTDHLTFDQNTKVVSTDASFTLVQKDDKGKIQTITGTGLSYDLGTETATVKNAHLELAAQTPGQVVYIYGKEIISYARKRFEIKEGTFTTCDFVAKQETPHYHVQTGSMEYVPDDHAQGPNAIVFIENRPVFWLPFFYIPLRRYDSAVQVGRNSVEGIFIKSAIPYRLNASNYGTLFLSGLEFKKPGAVGFDHVWDNSPNSMSALTLYGLPLPDLADYNAQTPYTLDDPWMVHGLNPANPQPFQDHYYRIRHQQRLFGTMTVDGWYEDRNIYDLTRITPTYTLDSHQQNPRGTIYRDDHYAWFAGVTDNRFGLSYGYNHNFREDRGYQRIRAVGDNANVSGAYGGTHFTETTGRTDNPQLPQYTSVVNGVAVTDPNATIQPNTSLHNNLTINQDFSADLKGSSTSNHTRTDPPGSPRSERLDQALNLTQTLGWGNLRLDAFKAFNLAIPATASVIEANQAIASLGAVDKLPELTLDTNPIFQNYQPITFQGVYGRYVEDTSYDPVAGAQIDTNTGFPLHPVARLDPVSRLKLKPSLTAHEIDLGASASLNFGSTGYEQRFYSTGDAEYQLTGQVSLSNKFTQYVNTNLTYHKDYSPPSDTANPYKFPFTPAGFTGINGSPFKQFEGLALLSQNTLNGAGNVVVGNAFTWNNTLGYNYQIQRYTPYSTGITVTPNPRINMTVNTGYTFADKPYLEFGTGKWSPINTTLQLRSADTGFGGVYGEDHLTPGWSLDITAVYAVDTSQFQTLTNRLSFDTGTTWQNHWAVVTDGQMDPITHHYQVLDLGIQKDLHDFILSVKYNMQLQSYTLDISMVAFPTDLVNLSNKTFGGVGAPGQLGAQLGSQLGFQ